MKPSILLPALLIFACVPRSGGQPVVDAPAPAVASSPVATPTAAEPAPVVAPPVDPALVDRVTAAALAGGWKEVIEQTEGVDLANTSPVLKLVRGHACIALNRNNEATLLFFGTRDPQQLEAYHAWAAGNLAKNPGDAFAHFFAGDAAARLARWDEAVIMLNAAIQKKTDFALAVNARGVVHAFRREIGDADEDFKSAAKLSPALADAQCNNGYLWIQRKEGGKKGAINSFTAALDACPGFGLALYGRSFIHISNGESESAGKDISVAQSLDPALCQLFEQADLLASFAAHKTVAAGTTTSLSAAGSSFQTKIQIPESKREEFQIRLDLDKAMRTKEEHGDLAGRLGWLGGGNDATIRALEYIKKTGGMTMTEEQRSYVRLTASEQQKWNASGAGAQKTGDAVFSASNGIAIGSGLATASGAGAGVGVVGTATSAVFREAGRRMDRTTDLNEKRAAGAPSALDLVTIEKPKMPEPIPGGGADANPTVIDGKWPFVAIYGLGYGVVE